MELIVTGAVVQIDAHPNGSVYVEGWDNDHAQLEATVEAFAPSADEARDIVSSIRIDTSGADVRTVFPTIGYLSTASVTYRLFVPADQVLSIRTYNGGVWLQNLAGDVRFETTNGTIRLTDVRGVVEGSTHNGGIRVDLGAVEAATAAISARTVNGGISVILPPAFAGELDVCTRYGTLNVDLPIGVRYANRCALAAGTEGSPSIDLSNTNGAVWVRTAEEALTSEAPNK